MEATNDWYEGIEKEISSLKDKISKGDYKLYKLDLLLRVAKRVVCLSPDCEYCQGHRNDISNLVTELRNLPEITKEEVANYGRTFRNIIKHIEKHHGFRSRGFPITLILLGTALLIPVILWSIGEVPGEWASAWGVIAFVYIGVLIAKTIEFLGLR